MYKGSFSMDESPSLHFFPLLRLAHHLGITLLQQTLWQEAHRFLTEQHLLPALVLHQRSSVCSPFLERSRERIVPLLSQESAWTVVQLKPQEIFAVTRMLYKREENKAESVTTCSRAGACNETGHVHK